MILTSKGIFDQNIEVAYVPMKTPLPLSFELDSSTRETLTIDFPLFFMLIFLFPFFYLVSRLAEEKEGKAREGMKMMGLKDATYFISWFLFYVGIILVEALIITAVIKPSFLILANAFLIFIMSFLYGISTFGIAVVLAAILPNSRSSATAATLFHIITYFLIFPILGT